MRERAWACTGRSGGGNRGWGRGRRGARAFLCQTLLSPSFPTPHIQGYVEAAVKAVKEDKVRLSLYVGWSLLDGLEWQEGMTKRFGIVYTNPDTLDRVPKKSAYWLANKFGTLKKKEAAAPAPAKTAAAAPAKAP